MTTLYSHKRIMGVALALLASGLANTVEAQPTGAPASSHITLHGFISTRRPDKPSVSAISRILPGLPHPCSTGRRERKRRTLRSAPMFQLSPLPANGDLQPDLFTAGSYAIYFNPQPIGDWDHPDSFSSGQPIATFKPPESFVSLSPQSFHSVIREELVSTQALRFNGHNYDFSAIAPGGLTLMDVGSTTQLPGINGDFSLVLPYAGSAIAVGGDY